MSDGPQLIFNDATVLNGWINQPLYLERKGPHIQLTHTHIHTRSNCTLTFFFFSFDSSWPWQASQSDAALTSHAPRERRRDWEGKPDENGHTGNCEGWEQMNDREAKTLETLETLCLLLQCISHGSPGWAEGSSNVARWTNKTWKFLVANKIVLPLWKDRNIGDEVRVSSHANPGQSYPCCSSSDVA